MTSPQPGQTPRTQLKRSPERAVFDREDVYQLLDSNWVAYVGVVDGEQPYVVPMAYARDGDRLLLHGSKASRVMKLLASGTPCCATVVELNGIVVARSGYESSMNYRSVMVIGCGRELSGDEVGPALDAVIEGLIPGRTSEVRVSKPKELAATMFVELELTECSMKCRSGPPDESDEDHELSIWGGVLPISTTFGRPEPDQWAVAKGLPVPPSVKRMVD
jgi:nitroimidazol reductase NimA-like FMN-containing flavoprotein (pyridoxamine 5'-phosphate oxidase superfamily)